MPQTLVVNHLHIVFSTKHRSPFITDQLRDRLHAYLSGTCMQFTSPTKAIGSVDDHVHILCNLNRQLDLSQVVGKVKSASSKWMKDQGEPRFEWQSGFGAFGVSHGNLPAIEAYIHHQHDHHHQRSFQEEFRDLLTRHGMTWDEKYVWD